MNSQKLLSTLFILVAVFIIQPNSIASQKHDGICVLLVSNTDDDNSYEVSGFTFMTQKINDVWAAKGGLDLNKRYMVSARHMEMNEIKIRNKINAPDFVQTDSNINKELLKNTYKFIKGKCGNIEFKLKRSDSASKPLKQGLVPFENEFQNQSPAECDRDSKTIKFNNTFLGVLKRGCDLAVYEIDYNSIVIKNAKGFSQKANEEALDQIIGFDPTLQLSRIDELKNVYFFNAEGSLTKCPVTLSLSSSLIATCSNEKFKTSHNTIEKGKLGSGSIIFAEDPESPNKVVSIDQKTPAALGVVTKRRCFSDTKECIIELDLIQLSADLERRH